MYSVATLCPTNQVCSTVALGLGEHDTIIFLNRISGRPASMIAFVSHALEPIARLFPWYLETISL